MPAGLKIKSNIKQWQKQAEQAANQISHGSLTRKISIKVSQRMRDWTKQGFLLGGVPEKWPPLAPATVIAKGTRGAGILRLTDRLFNSVTGSGGENIAKMRRSSFGYKYEFGTTVPYGEFHQEGTANMPARPFLQMTESQEIKFEETVGNITVAHLKRLPFFDALKGAGFNISSGMPGQAVSS